MQSELSKPGSTRELPGAKFSWNRQNIDDLRDLRPDSGWIRPSLNDPLLSLDAVLAPSASISSTTAVAFASLRAVWGDCDTRGSSRCHATSSCAVIELMLGFSIHGFVTWSLVALLDLPLLALISPSKTSPPLGRGGAVEGKDGEGQARQNATILNKTVY